MAAVAAEPGAAVVPITTTTAATDDGGHLEPGLGGPSHRGQGLGPGPSQEYAPVLDLVDPHHVKDGDVVVVVEECGHVRPELEAAAAGKAFATSRAGDEESSAASDGGGPLSKYAPSLSGGVGERLLAVERFSPALGEAEVGSSVQAVYHHHQSITTDSQPSAVFLHSFPAHPPVTEAGLSLAEPAEPTTTNNDYYQNRIEPRVISHDNNVDGYTSLVKPELGGGGPPEPAEDNPGSAIYRDVAVVEDAVHGTADCLSLKEGQVQVALRTASTDLDTATGYVNNCDFSSSSVGTENKHYPVVKDELLPVTGQAGSVTASPASASSLSGSGSRTLQDPCPSSSPCRSPKRRLLDATHLKQEKLGMGLEPAAEASGGAESKPSLPCHVVSEPPPVVDQLTPGSEVRVSLDHIIDDALVVSFRVGEKIFSGVLMDLSKRFGPYGIPITVFPKRDYKDRPQLTMQLQPTQQQQQQPPQEAERPGGVPAKTHAVLDTSCPEGPDHQRLRGEGQAVAATPQPSQTAPPPPHPWSSKPPPLFQEGAPYPPPLFIRDTYNQALPQPPPRKIKRPKRRYRCEEPTSIMNAIKLRPRQVLCDKCKAAVGSGNGGVPREARRGPSASSDSRGEDAAKRKRQADGGSVVSKRLRNETPREDKGGRGVADRRSASGLRVSSGSSSGRIPRGVASSSSSVSHSANSSRVRLKLNSKQKVLGAKGAAVECSKARHVLKKLSRTSQPRIQSTRGAPQPPAHHRRQPKDSSANSNPLLTGPKTMTRSASLQEASQNQKVHFTRRLQHLNTAVVGSNPRATPLPPRMRIKPQRYRTEDNQVSPPNPAPKQQLRLPPVRASARVAPPPKQPALSPAPHPSPVQALAQPLVQVPPPAANISPDVPTCPPAPSLSPSPSSSASTGVASFAVEVREVSARQPESEGREAEEQEKRGTAGGCTEGGGGVSQGRASLVVYVSAAEASSSHPQADSSSSSGSVDLEDLKSTNSECSSTETFDLLPPGELLVHSSYCSSSSYSSSSTPPPPPPPSFSSPSLPSAASSSSSASLTDASAPPPLTPPPQGSEEGQGEEEEVVVNEGEGEGVVGEDGAGEEPKRRRKSSTCSSSSSSSSSKTPTTSFTKSVLKCAAPDGRTVCVGDIVWAKIYGFPWWPARVLGITVSRGAGAGLAAVLQEARVSWFGSPTTSFLPLAQVAPFLESFQTRFDKKRRGPYRRAITEAARAAKQLTPEVRALLTQFET